MAGQRVRRKGFDRQQGNWQEVGTRQLTKELTNEVASAIAFNRPSAKYMTGARTVVKINDTIIGFAFQVTWNVQNETMPIYTIDDVAPWEIAPQRVSVSGTLGLFQIPGNSPVKAGIMTDLSSFLANKYITIEVKDSSTDSILFKTTTAMATSLQADVNSEKLSTYSISWRAVGWQAEVSYKALEPKIDIAPPSYTGDIGPLPSQARRFPTGQA